jgi:tetratricopeptide (TPR) repeat protein
MFRKYVFTTVASVALLTSAAFVASGQTGELRGHANIKQADGQTTPASDAAIDVYRTDLPGKYNTKTNKKGEFVFAGLPYIGTYIIAASHPTAAPTFLQGIKAGREVDYELSMSPGDGKRLTLDQINAMASGGGAPSSGGSKESAESRAKREELVRKNAEILEKNKKIEETNSIVARTYKAGNEAFVAKNYDEAIKQYDEGLAADPEQPALLTNKGLALKARGVDRYNAAITSKDDAAKTPGIEAAKNDFKAAADTTAKAVALLKAQPVPAEPTEQARYNTNKLATLSTRAETMRLFVTKADQTQVEAGQAAFEEYIAAETDAAKKAKAQHDLAQMLFDANAFDKALAAYQKILAENPDDLDALLRSGQALFNIGAISNDKAKYQEAANFLARFVDKAPDTNALKADAKAILDALKDQENVKPEKSTTPARRRRP